MAEVIPHPMASGSGISAPAPLNDQHEFSTFDCGKEPLNDWLKDRSRRSEGLSARAYVVAVGKLVIGYYCVSTGAILQKELPGHLRRNMPNPVPMMTLGRLAVDKAYQRQGIGPAMLKDALQRILMVSRQVGARAVLVHAIDDDAKAFYVSFGFKAFSADSRTMFLSITDIAASLG